MSILDKPLTPRPQRAKRGRIIIILSIVAVILIALLVFTDVRADTAFVIHFATAPDHFTYRGHSDYVSAVAWSPDGKRIASASGDHTVQVWDASDGNHVYTYHGHSADVSTLAWSPDGKYIASAGLDNSVQVWGATTGNLVYIYHGQNDVIYNVAWSPDGTRIASASNDGSVQVWHAFTGYPILNYKNPPTTRGSPAPWYAITWSPDGKQIAIGGIGNVLVIAGNAVLHGSDHFRVANFVVVTALYFDLTGHLGGGGLRRHHRLGLVVGASSCGEQQRAVGDRLLDRVE